MIGVGADGEDMKVEVQEEDRGVGEEEGEEGEEGEGDDGICNGEGGLDGGDGGGRQDITKQEAEEIRRALDLISDKVTPAALEFLLRRVSEAEDGGPGSKSKGQGPTGRGEQTEGPTRDKRQQLTPEQAVEVFMLRPQPNKDGVMRRGSMLHCKTIAPKFHVTPKTVGLFLPHVLSFMQDTELMLVYCQAVSA